MKPENPLTRFTPFILLILLSACGTPGNPSSVPPPAQTRTVQSSLPVQGVFVHQFLRRNYPGGYFSGEVIHDFDAMDYYVGHTVAKEVSYQLDLMRQMGVNTITFELRPSDPVYHPGPFTPPECNIPPTLGLQYPVPTESEIENLVRFLDLLHGKDIKVILMLSNTHMEEQPPTSNELWLGSILTAVKDHPALELVSFGGSAHTLGEGANAVCGLPAEAPLWEGPSSVSVIYVKWAIAYAHSLGIPFRKLSAEAIIGDYYTMNQSPGYAGMTDGHIWDPLVVLKGIFDDLSVPDDQRTYGVSFHEHHRCVSTAQGVPCTDTGPHAWAMETVGHVYDTIGRDNGARVIAVEMGLLPNTPTVSPQGVSYTPVTYADWNYELALESLVWIMQTYGMDGGCYYRWTNGSDADESDPTVAETVLQRGTDYTFNPIKDVLENLYTAGRLGGFDPTPDVILPNAISASASPGVVANGETLDLVVELGEPYHFVTVDISDLDTNRTGLVVLLDQGDGTYRRTVTLNPWNGEQNGARLLTFQAMDVWGNTTTATIPVELNNPAPVLDATPPDDNFNTAIFNPRKWTTDMSGGGQVRQNGNLILSTGDQEAFSSARVVSTWQFSGDFDVQAGFEIGEGWATPSNDHLDGAALGVNIAGESYHITRLRNSSEDSLFAWSTSGYVNGKALTTALTGEYRLIRIGTTLHFLYDTGVGWVELGTTTVPSDPARVYLGNASINASQAFMTRFDDFKINSGLTTYKP